MGKINAFIVLIFFLLSSCGEKFYQTTKDQRAPSSRAARQHVPTPEVENCFEYDLKNMSKSLFAIGLSSKPEIPEKYSKLVKDAIGLLNETFNDAEFRELVRKKKFDWVGLAEIPDSFQSEMRGQDVLDELILINNQPSVSLKFTRRPPNPVLFWSGSMGMTYVNSNSTTTYKYWIDMSPSQYKCTLFKYTAHLAHEFSHQVGFVDKDSNPAGNRDVVPYYIGDTVCAFLNTRYQSNCGCNN